MIWVLGLFITSAMSQQQNTLQIDFLQLSIDETADESIVDNSKILSIFFISLTICLICCGVLQIVIILSKRMTAELIALRKNYKQYQGLLKFREFKRAYNYEVKNN